MNATLRLPSLHLPFLIFRTMLRKAGEALLITATLYGMAFGMLSVTGVMPMFARSVIFHPHLAVLLKTVIPIAYAAIFASLLFAETVGGLVWLGQNSQYGARLSAQIQSWKIVTWIKAHQYLATFLAISGVILVCAMLPSAHPVTPPMPPAPLPFHPANKVLLHFEGESEVSTSNKYPPMIWTRNISGPAKIKNLGDGRYLVQMIR